MEILLTIWGDIIEQSSTNQNTSVENQSSKLATLFLSRLKQEMRKLGGKNKSNDLSSENLIKMVDYINKKSNFKGINKTDLVEVQKYLKEISEMNTKSLKVPLNNAKLALNN